MQHVSQRTLTLLAGALGAFLLTFPMRSSADPYRYTNEEAWRGVQHEREELDEAQDAMRQDQQQLRHEEREMDAARQAGDWRDYQHERREAEQARENLQEDRAQVAHEREELREQQHTLHHHHHHHDDD
jgi:hypothetical protein